MYFACFTVSLERVIHQVPALVVFVLLLHAYLRSKLLFLYFEKGRCRMVSMRTVFQTSSIFSIVYFSAFGHEK